MTSQNRRRTKDEEVVALAKSILSRYSESHILLRSFEDSCRGDENMLRISRIMRIAGSSGEDYISSFQNRHMRELLKMIRLGTANGMNIEKGLSLFIRNLDREILLKNRMAAKMGGAQTLTKMGMCLFFPLFSGISATIISESLDFVSKNVQYTRACFLIVAVAYIPIILYISAAFAHPERSVAQNAFSILPYFSVAVCVILLTQNYLVHFL
ncbi:MAG: hypothetical protein ABSD68_02765 [Candidatus Micrarchaeales archaeon]|jgi:hypothetical protein